MAYVRGDSARGQTQVVIANADGSNPQPLATRQFPPSEFTTVSIVNGLGWNPPAWSPDGATLAVLGNRTGFAGQVVFLDARTGAEHVVEMGPPLLRVGAGWLDDATLVLSMLDRSSAPLQLWLLSYPKGEFSRLTNDPSQYVGVSLTADRNRLATARSEASFTIWTSDANATQWTQMVPPTPQKGPIGFDVRGIGEDLIFPSMASGNWALERWHASTRTTEILAIAGGAPQVSQDGATIVFFDYDIGQLISIDAGGRNKTRLGRVGTSIRLTPDGKQLAFIDTVAGTPTVRIRPIAGDGGGREITNDRARAGGVAQVSPDGRRIAYASTMTRSAPPQPCATSPRVRPDGPFRWPRSSGCLAATHCVLPIPRRLPISGSSRSTTVPLDS